MEKKVKKSARNHDDVAPPFVVDHSRVAKISDKPRKEPPREHSDASAPKQVKKVSRLPEIIARIFQGVAYICIAVGILSVLAVVVIVIMTFWPTNETTTTIVGSGAASNSGDSWVWLMVGGVLAPAILSAFQVIIGVIGILIMIYLCKKAIYTARKLVWRIADEFLWRLTVVEPVLLLSVHTVVILCAWWLASAELFISLTTFAVMAIVVGLLSLLIMRKLSGDKLDFTRADVK